MTPRDGATPGSAPEVVAHKSNGRYANHEATSAIESEAIPRIQAIVTNASASLLGDLDADTALISTVRLGEAVLRWIAIDLAEHDLAVAS